MNWASQEGIKWFKELNWKFSLMQTLKKKKKKPPTKGVHSRISDIVTQNSNLISNKIKS